MHHDASELNDASFIQRFVDETVLPRRSPEPGIPVQWRSGESTDLADDDWHEWAVFDSEVSDSDLDALEARFAIKLPMLLRAYFQHRIVFSFDCGVLRMPDMRPDNALGALIQTIALRDEVPMLQEHDLVPFADDGNDAGPVCYIDNGTASGGGVVVVDHERLRDAGYAGELKWASLRHVFEHIEDDMQAYDHAD